MKTLVTFIDVEGLSDPEFEQLLKAIFNLRETRGRLKFNVFEQDRDEVINHADKLWNEKETK